MGIVQLIDFFGALFVKVAGFSILCAIFILVIWIAVGIGYRLKYFLTGEY